MQYLLYGSVFFTKKTCPYFEPLLYNEALPSSLNFASGGNPVLVVPRKSLGVIFPDRSALWVTAPVTVQKERRGQRCRFSVQFTVRNASMEATFFVACKDYGAVYLNNLLVGTVPKVDNQSAAVQFPVFVRQGEHTVHVDVHEGNNENPEVLFACVRNADRVVILRSDETWQCNYALPGKEIRPPDMQLQAWRLERGRAYLLPGDGSAHNWGGPVGPLNSQIVALCTVANGMTVTSTLTQLLPDTLVVDRRYVCSAWLSISTRNKEQNIPALVVFTFAGQSTTVQTTTFSGVSGRPWTRAKGFFTKRSSPVVLEITAKGYTTDSPDVLVTNVDIDFADEALPEIRNAQFQLPIASNITLTDAQIQPVALSEKPFNFADVVRGSGLANTTAQCIWMGKSTRNQDKGARHRFVTEFSVSNVQQRGRLSIVVWGGFDSVVLFNATRLGFLTNGESKVHTYDVVFSKDTQGQQRLCVDFTRSGDMTAICPG